MDQSIQVDDHNHKSDESDGNHPPFIEENFHQLQFLSEKISLPTAANEIN